LGGAKEPGCRKVFALRDDFHLHQPDSRVEGQCRCVLPMAEVRAAAKNNIGIGRCISDYLPYII
jgi:hypothetical protein